MIFIDLQLFYVFVVSQRMGFYWEQLYNLMQAAGRNDPPWSLSLSMKDISLAKILLSTTSWMETNGQSRTELDLLTNFFQFPPVPVRDSTPPAHGVRCRGHHCIIESLEKDPADPKGPQSPQQIKATLSLLVACHGTYEHQRTWMSPLTWCPSPGCSQLCVLQSINGNPLQAPLCCSCWAAREIVTNGR